MVANVSWGHGDVAGASEEINLLDPQRIVISPSSLELDVDETSQMSATAYYRDGSSLDVTLLGRWTSLDVSVAPVNAAGLVTGAAEGTTTLRFVYGTAANSAAVEVLPPPVPAPTPGDDDEWYWATV